MLYQGRILPYAPQAFRESSEAIVQQFIRGMPDGPMEL